MSKPRRLLPLVGGATAALLTSFIVPTAFGHADDAVSTDCIGAVCLVMGDKVQGDYGGLRPFFTNWQGDQPYTVQVAQDDGSSIDAGSYHINIDDFWSPIIANSTYHYGDFTPTAEASDLDLAGFEDLSGTTVYNTSYFGGVVNQLAINEPGGANFIVISSPAFTNTLVATGDESADFVQYGASAPTQLWNSLDDSGFAQVPNYVLPPDPWAALDFDPSNFLFAT